MNALAVRLLGYVAQAFSYALAGIFLLFLLGEIFTPHSAGPVNLREWTGIILITIACCAPVLALQHEFGAAAVSLACLAGFCLVVDFDNWPIAAILAVPGALHLAHSLLDRPGQPPRQTLHPAS
ncbi:MAG: hypothetical protein IPJ98_29265 [Bryobacterales bacterium]|nr:hypothetical protein [Bryobacterales bacterium]